ncbi:MAG: hypothetical protein ABI601_01325 [bacterium]
MSVRPTLATLLFLAAIGTPAYRASSQQVAFATSGATELDSATQAALTRDVTQARSRGLPVEPLLAKVREGQIKRARPERIRSAVAALMIRLDSARTALGSASNATELVAGADALGAGADASALRAVRTASGARDVAAPLGALAQLVATGVPTRRAAQMIVDLIRRDVSPSQVLAFGVAVETDVGAGVPPTESALFRMRQIEASLSLGDKVTTAAPGAGGALQNGPGVSGGTPRRRP